MEERVRFLKTQMGAFDPGPKEVIWGTHGGVCTPVGGGKHRKTFRKKRKEKVQRHGWGLRGVSP